jgi:hypothetical protein
MFLYSRIAFQAGLLEIMTVRFVRAPRKPLPAYAPLWSIAHGGRRGKRREYG